MKIVLDTHVAIFAAAGKLSDARSSLLQDPTNRLFLSSISLWEIVKLYEAKRVDFEEGLESFLLKISSHPRYTILGLIPEVLVQIPILSQKMHKDPADQIIVASTLYLEGQLMTNDDKIKESKLVLLL